MKKKELHFFVVILCLGIVSCSGRNWKETWVLENTLDEEVTIVILRSNRSLVDDRGYAEGDYSLAPYESLELISTSRNDQSGWLTPSEAFYIFFRESHNIIVADSLILNFENNGLLSFNIYDNYIPMNPLNFDLKEEGSWELTNIDKNDIEFRYKIRQEHKQAAN